ncbi:MULTISPECIES: ABC transporter permease [Brenneria]|uniref:ABC transporter permease n=1 Tax=Brenneria nigrifluens DSM 30175 = ATCC 13028 TaxID=1121120 RepID=A0A2U1UP09_9GAMM|nr:MULTISPECIES: ABC transporter permease [Brenneria]EHD19584.1 ABC-type transporter, integral membrane subunit [Brenneria sp. EniD312]PWC23312.1 ABC transporter permease [Brenneria nigrifluens] [Brenneria nigrifluens DSM 30175 = ATCC 13028]QCR02852.1 ABC transporter permease [Brenneria nigrifluens] [Brenneria nigrifluens DSM 30175 = ATCC 13028]
MLTFTGKRLLATLPVLLVVAVAIFMIVRLIPGDPAAVIGGNSATSEDIDRIREQLGLTLPLWKQFAIWAQGVLHGDFGYSFFMNQPVTSLLMQRMEPTLSLTFGTLLFTVLIALPLGALAAWRMGGWLDRCVMACSVVGFSIPVFVIGYLLIYVLALKLQWLPVQGYNPLSKGFLPWLNNLILPCLTLSVTYVALLARVTRAAVSEALTEDFIRTARAKGITELQVLRHHALRVAAVPVATVIGVSAALLLGGVVVTETVFAIPGLGQLTVDAVLNRDFPVLQGVVLFFAVTYILLNFLIDLSYLWLDPRIRNE